MESEDEPAAHAGHKRWLLAVRAERKDGGRSPPLWLWRGYAADHPLRRDVTNGDTAWHSARRDCGGKPGWIQANLHQRFHRWIVRPKPELAWYCPGRCPRLLSCVAEWRRGVQPGWLSDLREWFAEQYGSDCNSGCSVAAGSRHGAFGLCGTHWDERRVRLLHALRGRCYWNATRYSELRDRL